VALAPEVFAAGPEEVRLRLLAGVLCWMSGAAYRPRLARLAPVAAAVAFGSVGHGLTLHGCVLRQRRARVEIRREPGRVSGRVPAATGSWDGRWRLARMEGARQGVEIAALGRAGLGQIPAWRACGTAGETLRSTPALWRGERLLAAPLAGMGNGAEFVLAGARPGYTPGYTIVTQLR
jgi:tRNA(Ile)-lysidine synthase